MFRPARASSWLRPLLFLRQIQRTYATESPPGPIPPSPRAAAAAQASSAPLKIKEKRAKLEDEFTRTPPEKRVLERWEKRALVRPPVSTKSERSRLRGVRFVRRKEGKVWKVVQQTVGQRIYLPNIVFTMIPNHTPTGKAYNPYEATFYIPNYLTKTDVRSYLHAVYGVECTYIRTDNYFMPMKVRRGISRSFVVNKEGRKTHKRAVVGLKEPFYYPQMVEDMNGKDRWLRENHLEDTFRIKMYDDVRKAISVKFFMNTRENDIKTLASQWDSRKKIIRRLWERKEERERATRDIAKDLEEARKQG